MSLVVAVIFCGALEMSSSALPPHPDLHFEGSDGPFYGPPHLRYTAPYIIRGGNYLENKETLEH